MGLVLLLVFGILISILNYMQSAQDRYKLAHLSKELVKFENKIQDIFKEEEDEPFQFLFQRIDRMGWGLVDLTTWRAKHIGVSRIPALCSIILVLFWAVLSCIILLK